MSLACFLLKDILCFLTLMRWKYYDSEIRTNHADIVADDLLLKVFKLHKLRRSLGHMEIILGCTYSGGALALLIIMHCWHYDDSEITSLSLEVFLVLVIKSHICNFMKRSC